MGRMPLGEPRSVPDPAGDLYDQQMAKIRAQRDAEDRGESPLDTIGDAWTNFRNGPRIPRPNTAETFIPVVGPMWEAAGDLQDGHYASAALNAGLAVADALPLGTAVKGVKALSKGVGILKGGSVTADAARKVIRRVGLAGQGEEIHHSVPLNGLGRNVQDWRNHYAFLKTLPKEQHRRLTGSWAGKPIYDPIRRAWYGPTDWMKTVPIGISAYGAHTLPNLFPSHPDSPEGKSPHD